MTEPMILIYLFSKDNAFENAVCEMAAILFKAQNVNSLQCACYHQLDWFGQLEKLYLSVNVIRGVNIVDI